MLAFNWVNILQQLVRNNAVFKYGIMEDHLYSSTLLYFIHDVVFS